MTSWRPNKALELTAVPASGNVAVFHICTGVAVVQFTVGGSSATAFAGVIHAVFVIDLVCGPIFASYPLQ